MKRPVVFTLILLIAGSSLFWVLPSHAQTYGAIRIAPDGSVEPASAPIQRVGDSYYLTADIYNSPITLERGGVTFDVADYTLEGAQQGAALNLTCSNVTVQNLKVCNWEVGILGAFNGNSITECNLTGNGKGVAIYADNYNITSNSITLCQWGIRIMGSNVSVAYNHLSENGIGIWVTSSIISLEGTPVGYAANSITYNSFELHDQIAIETDYGRGILVHHNNFNLNNIRSPIVSTVYTVFPGDETQVVMPPWDDGAEGNYWSDYNAKYPNATEIGTSGIEEVPYVINIAPNLTDRYPLAKQVDITTPVSPTATSSPSPSPQQTSPPIATATPSEQTISPPPSKASPSLTPNVTPSPQQLTNAETTNAYLALAVGIAFGAIAAVLAAAMILTRKKRSAAT